MLSDTAKCDKHYALQKFHDLQCVLLVSLVATFSSTDVSGSSHGLMKGTANVQRENIVNCAEFREPTTDTDFDRL